MPEDGGVEDSPSAPVAAYWIVEWYLSELDPGYFEREVDPASTEGVDLYVGSFLDGGKWSRWRLTDEDLTNRLLEALAEDAEVMQFRTMRYTDGT